MNMSVEHVGVVMLSDFLNKAKDDLSIDHQDNIRFLEARIKYLDGYLDELESNVSTLEEKLKNDLQELITVKGAEILSIKQLIRLAAKECGVCEANLERLKELENGENNA